MLKQKQIQKITFADLAALTASTLNTPEFAYISSENAFYTKIGGVNTLIDRGGDDWSLTGNAGTTAGTNFIGTTDNVNVKIKKNNLDEIIIEGNGQFTLNNTNRRNAFFRYGNTVAGNATATGSFNGVWGGNGLQSLTTGSNNGIVNSDGLYNLTNGTFNNLFGSYGLLNVTSGRYNSLVSAQGLYALTTGTNNGIANGEGLNALTNGQYNGIVSGAGLEALTTGNYNGILNGRGLNKITGGTSNAILGGYGLLNITSGNYNSLLNGYGMFSLQAGSYNAVINGVGLESMTQGSYNLLIGGTGLSSVTKSSNVISIGENNELTTLKIPSIPFANLTFTNTTKTYTVGGATVLGATVTGTDVTTIIADNVAKGNVINTLSTLDLDKQNVPFYNALIGNTAAWMLDANTLFIPFQNITSGVSVLYSSSNFNNIFMVGRNITATKSNQFIIGGQDVTEVKFRGQAGYNYAHDVSAILGSTDDGKMWTYEHSTASIKMKRPEVAINTPISTVATLTPYNIDFQNRTEVFQLISLPPSTSLTNFTTTNFVKGGRYTIQFTQAQEGIVNDISFSTSFVDKNGGALQNIHGLRGSVVIEFICTNGLNLTQVSTTEYRSRGIQATHANVTIADYTTEFYYKPTTLSGGGQTITMPANPEVDEELTIYFGGDAANTAATLGAITIAPNTGQFIVNNGLPLNQSRVNGETVTLRFSNNDTWRIKSRYVPS